MFFSWCFGWFVDDGCSADAGVGVGVGVVTGPLGGELVVASEGADDDGVGADFRSFFADGFFAFSAGLEISNDFVGAVRRGAQDGDLGGFLGRELLVGVVAVGDIGGAGAEEKRGGGCEEERNAGDHKEESVLLGFAGLAVENCSDI